MAHITEQQLEHIQRLSNISLKDTEKEIFLQKLEPIISKLDELNKVDTSSIVWDSIPENTLRVLDQTFDWEKQKKIVANIIKNVQHEVINNSIVIKSVLS